MPAKKEFTDEQIEEGLRLYFMPTKDWRKLNDFEKVVVVPSQQKAFEAVAPKMLHQMWNEKQRNEKRKLKKERVDG